MKVENPKWLKEKPNYACKFIGKNGDDYEIYEFNWVKYDDYEYLAYCDSNGYEIGDIDEDCNCEEYLVFDIEPPDIEFTIK